MAGLVTSQMSKDWNDYWGRTKAGDSQAWGNGSLVRNADGGATYKSNTGQSTNFNAGMSIEDFAKSNGEIGNVLYNNYGYKASEPAIEPAKVPTFQPVVAATGSGPAAVTRTVNDNELTSANLQKLLQSNSPYLQQARDKAMLTANSRGLVNSTLAAGAGESAAIDAALPIASADAGTYTTAARDNQSATNNFNLADRQAANQSALAAAQAQMQAQMNDINSTRQENLSDRQFMQQGQRQQEQNNFAAGQTDKAQQFQAGQTDKSQQFQMEQLKQNMNLAYDKMTVDQTNTYANGYLNIVNSNMPQEDKQIALSKYSAIYGFNDGYTSTTSVDLSGLPAAQSVVNSYWSSGKAGDSGAWGDGKITHNGDGTATYTTKDGRNIALNRGMSLSDLAATDAEVSANLKKYGYGG